MEMMPFHPGRDAAPDPALAAAPPGDAVLAGLTMPTFGRPTGDWTAALPALGDGTLTLRELTVDDAPSLFAHLTTEDVARFISPPPTSVEGFEDFIRWTHLRRAQGRYACFGIVPALMATEVHVRPPVAMSHFFYDLIAVSYTHLTLPTILRV